MKPSNFESSDPKLYDKHGYTRECAERISDEIYKDTGQYPPLVRVQFARLLAGSFIEIGPRGASPAAHAFLDQVAMAYWRICKRKEKQEQDQ